MKKFLFLIPAILFALGLFSQTNTPNVLSSGGTCIKNGNLINSFTIGEISVTTAVNSSYIITQGFQQPVTTLRIKQQPHDIVCCEKVNISFAVQASGGGLYAYQWYKNNNLLPGKTMNTLVFDMVLQADSGFYFCHISNQYGELNTDTVKLTVYQVPVSTFSIQEPGCINSENIINYIGNASVNGNYHWTIQDIDTVLSGPGPHTIEWSSLGNKNITLHVDENNCYSDTANYTINIHSLPAVTFNPSNYIICEGFPADFQANATGDGIIKQWQVNHGSGWLDIINDSIYSGVNANTLHLSNTYVSMDNNQYRMFVSGTCPPSVNTTTATLTVKGNPRILFEPANQEGCQNQTVQFVVLTSGTNLHYQWYQSSNDVTFSPVFSAISNNLTMSVVPSVNGYLFFCEIHGDCGTTIFTDTVSLTLTNSPAITGQAQNMVVCEGESAGFGITATGQNLTYQWENYYLGDWYSVSGSDYSGINSDTLTILSANLSFNNNIYRCKVSGDCSAPIYSIPKTLTVNSPVHITTQPINKTVCTGNSVSFSVQSTGSNITYQWYESTGIGWAQLAGQTNNTFTIASVNSGMDGKQFYCLIAGDCNSTTTTDTVTLFVKAPVVFLQHPAGANLCAGNDYQMSVLCNGSSPISYQWQLNLADIPGADSSVFMIQNSTLADGGLYLCVATNFCGSVQSNSATIAVHPKPDVQIASSGDTVICFGDNVTLTATAGFSYFWSTGSALQSITVNESGNYFVIAGNQYGCSDTSNIIGVDVKSPYSEQGICLVTVDIATGKNIIIWEKPVLNSIVSFNIYREVAANIYNWIGNVGYTQESIFIDYSSNPESHGDKYKISVLDTCSNESEYSYYHKTMNLGLSNFGSTMYLNWDEYVDESGAFIPPRYYIYRGTSPTSMALYDSISSSFTSYNDANIFDVYYYMVGVSKLSPCSTGAKTSYSSSFSNQKDNSDLVRISELNSSLQINIYPNPTKKQVIIEGLQPCQIEIMNIQGQVIKTIETFDKKISIDLSKLSGGVYTIKIITDKDIIVKKLIKQ
ncbi:MAG: T9SS type A sorting domain-containing protein [Bacteroidia bacterium]|nr:T9SS type A sorting domain-containing protein [Bacteroidia bacterium]